LKLADGAAADGETFHARDEKNKMGIVDLITAKAVHVPGGGSDDAGHRPGLE